MRVFATRPKAQNTAWAARLRKQGFDVVESSLLEINPLSEDQQRPIINLVLELDHYQKAVFVSQNAVEHAFSFIQQYWPQLPVGISWFAVGTKTNRLLREYLEESSCFFKVPSDTEVMNSEDLLNLPALSSVEDEKVVIFRGTGGRDLIRTTLESRGAEVHYCELYKRGIPSSASQRLIQANLQNNDVIPLFSGESLENLDSILSSGAAGLAEPILVLPGERVAQLAQELDYERYVIAKNASEIEMCRAIESVRATNKAI